MSEEENRRGGSAAEGLAVGALIIAGALTPFALAFAVGGKELLSIAVSAVAIALAAIAGVLRDLGRR